MLISIVHGLFWGLDIYVRQYFFDAAADLATGMATLRGVGIAFAMLAFTAIFTQFLNGLSNYMWEAYIRREMQTFRFDINARIKKLSPELFENTAALDDINKAEKGASAATDLMTINCAYPVFLSPLLHLCRLVSLFFETRIRAGNCNRLYPYGADTVYSGKGICKA